MRPVIDELHQRLLERVCAQDNPEVAILTAALTNILVHDNRANLHTEVLPMAAWGDQGVLDSPSLRVMRGKMELSRGATWRMNPGGIHEDIPAQRDASPNQA